MSENATSDNNARLMEGRELWDNEAAAFDNEPDHGLRDPKVRTAWTDLLRNALPLPPLTVLDIGCGTGSLSLVLAELGYQVTGIDLSPAMIAQAEAKAEAAHQTIRFHVMDAAFPQLQQQFDAIVCRHLLWTLPQIDQVLQRWTSLLKPGGRLLLVEGFWSTGVGLHAQQILDALPPSLSLVSIQDLRDQPDLWGRTITDERYAIIAQS